MKRTTTLGTIVVLALVLVLVAGLSVQLPQGAAHAQDPDQEVPAFGIAAPQAQVGTSFTYQGWLNDGGSPADGEYDFRFRLHDDPTVYSPVARTILIEDHPVSAGLFTVQLGFGGVFAGAARYLEIGVRPGDSTGNYTTLSPRQPLTPVPYALALPGLRTQENADSPNVIGGYISNTVAPGVIGATIGGGGDDTLPNAVLADYATIGGGRWNAIGDNSGYSTIGGGYNNDVGGSSGHSTIGGGYDNDVGYGIARATISGGFGNNIEGSSSHATIGGGWGNLINGTATFATIPGGRENEAWGDYAFAAGRRAKANNQGCFVWGDSTDDDVACNNDNRWVARASGGVYFYTNSGLTSGMYLAAGGSSWNSVSDRNAKENFQVVDTQQLLARLAEIPITTWNYKSQDPSIRHVGPMAQDFNALLPDLGGEGEEYINTLDADGVALAAIQGLYAQNQELAAENAALKSQVSDLEIRLTALERGGVSRSPALGLSAGLLLGGLVLAGGVALQRRVGGGK